MRCYVSLLAALVVAGAAAPLPAQDGADWVNPAVSTARLLWEPMVGYITTAAEEVPESTYAYRPTPEVRSFGQLVGHVAGAQYLICAAALEDAPRNEDDIEKTRKTKSELVAALKASTQYCARAYGQSDKAAQQKTKLFGQERTRLYALGLNATHDAEHYGNIVTYLRINGLVRRPAAGSRPRDRRCSCCWCTGWAGQLCHCIGSPGTCEERDTTRGCWDMWLR